VSSRMEEYGKKIALEMMKKYAPAEEYLKAAEKLKPKDARAQFEADVAAADAAYQNLLALKAGATPGAAFTAAQAWMISANAAYLAATAGLVAFEALTAGQVDVTLTGFLNTPSLRSWFAVAEAISRTDAECGLLPLLRRYYLRQYKPFIPPIQDLRLMAVREAFPVAPGEPQYREMEKWALEQGMDPYWTQRYLYMGFIRMDIRQAYENLWRGEWTSDEFQAFLRISDIHPDDREPVTRVAFRPPGMRELGYGYDVGEYDPEDIVRYRRWGGLSKADAEKAAKSMVAYRTEAEREALRREAIADFEAWLDDEPQLRANLKAIGTRDEVADLWVARATYRRARDLALDMVKVSVDQYVKGHVKDAALDQDLIEYGIIPEGRAKIIAEAKTRRLKYAREETAAQKKIMPESRVRLARDLGLIGDQEYVRRLMEHDWTEEDARLDLAIELTPKPVTAEEISRRQRTALSRKARAQRRYESSLARLQAQIDLSAAQIEDAEATAKESLDIVDAQLTAIDLEMPTATAPRAAALERHRTVLLQRRELQDARSTAQIRRLTEQRTDLEEAEALTEKQRDEELAEYDEELKLLGAAA